MFSKFIITWLIFSVIAVILGVFLNNKYTQNAKFPGSYIRRKLVFEDFVFVFILGPVGVLLVCIWIMLA